MSKYDPKDFPHPGKALLAELEDIGLSMGNLARFISADPALVSAVISGEAAMTPTLACKLSAALGGGPRKWLEMQMNHDLARVDEAEYKGIRRLGGNRDED
jgi:addiction module HigA family antidote